MSGWSFVSGEMGVPVAYASSSAAAAFSTEPGSIGPSFRCLGRPEPLPAGAPRAMRASRVVGHFFYSWRHAARRHLLRRAVAVLTAFRADDGGLGAAELARRSGLPKSTAHRIALDLAEAGLLERDGTRAPAVHTAALTLSAPSRVSRREGGGPGARPGARCRGARGRPAGSGS
ncbi:helix-turn-helix domain-containing protein [Actinomadura chokoriensis]|uniref:Helix-turn-helix domain-containing protein n=1 Tax=Actinomadura chokoriensis TaxID=454156 RepID=A0ABV4QTJ6_9ACTN